MFKLNKELQKKIFYSLLLSLCYNILMSKYFTITDLENNLQIDIDFEVQDNSWSDLAELSLKISKILFNKLNLGKIAKHIEFSITLTNNQSIQKINLQYRGKDAATNTLSFPAQDIIEGKLEDFQIQDGFLSLGDVIFAYGVIEDEAKRDGKTFQDHFTHLLIHGLLHLFGYDHQNDQEAQEMENLETEILLSLDIKSPYE